MISLKFSAPSSCSPSTVSDKGSSHCGSQFESRPWQQFHRAELLGEFQGHQQQGKVCSYEFDHQIQGMPEHNPWRWAPVGKQCGTCEHVLCSCVCQ